MAKRLHSESFDTFELSEQSCRDIADAIVEGVVRRVRSTPGWIQIQQTIDRLLALYAKTELERRMLFYGFRSKEGRKIIKYGAHIHGGQKTQSKAAVKSLAAHSNEITANFERHQMPPFRRPWTPIVTQDIKTPMPAAKADGLWLFSWSESLPIPNEAGHIERFERRQVWTFHKKGKSRLRF